MNVHQILSGAGPVDAVTGQALAYRRLFAAWGWGGRDYAASIDRRVGGAVAPLGGLDPAPEDVLLIHYSAYAPKLAAVLERSNPKLLVYHNVTPARWFWDFEPTIAVHCSLGRRQLPDFVAAVDLAAGVSHFNVAELVAAGAARTAVIPILFTPPAAAAGGRDGPPEPPPTVLFVGRLTPHKRQDELIGVFSLYRRHRRPDARLVLVGEPLSPGYGRSLVALADRLAPGAVSFRAGIAPAELWRCYEQAHVFVCLSEHEGFCVPLLEAMAFEVPVVASAAGAIPDTLGGAGIVLTDDDPMVWSAAIARAASDPSLRAELVGRGRRRLADFSDAAVEGRLSAALAAAGLHP